MAVQIYVLCVCVYIHNFKYEGVPWPRYKVFLKRLGDCGTNCENIYGGGFNLPFLYPALVELSCIGQLIFL